MGWNKLGKETLPKVTIRRLPSWFWTRHNSTNSSWGAHSTNNVNYAGRPLSVIERYPSRIWRPGYFQMSLGKCYCKFASRDSGYLWWWLSIACWRNRPTMHLRHSPTYFAARVEWKDSIYKLHLHNQCLHRRTTTQRRFLALHETMKLGPSLIFPPCYVGLLDLGGSPNKGIWIGKRFPIYKF